MRRAVTLAWRGLGRVAPNPIVGCVVVRDGAIVGQGWHRRYGGPHAEVKALRQAGGGARGARLYVTLEPCSSHGKTPPCTDAIVAAGIARVVYGAADPLQSGAQVLRKASVRVTPGVLAGVCREQNPYFFRRARGERPFVMAKWAMSADGRTETPPGRSKWISCEASRRLAHHWRGAVDGLCVGVGTVLADDPLLTCRVGLRNPKRVILDTRARTPPNSRLVRSTEDAPVIVLVGPEAPGRRVEVLRKAGCRVTQVPAGDEGIDLAAALRALRKEHDVRTLMVEGGGRVLASFFRGGLVDEVRIFLAPRLLGKARHAPPASIWAMEALARTLGEARTVQHATGSDLLLVCRFARSQEKTGKPTA